MNAWGAALADFPCLHAPAVLPEARQYFARYDVGGVGIELSTVEVAAGTDIIETYGAGPWQHFARIPCGLYAVPTVRLELRLITELRRQRPEQYEPIIRPHAADGCDLEFVRRAMADAKVRTLVRNRVLDQLRAAPVLKMPA